MTGDLNVNTAFGGRLVCWREPDGHLWEMSTVDYAREIRPPDALSKEAADV